MKAMVIYGIASVAAVLSMPVGLAAAQSTNPTSMTPAGGAVGSTHRGTTPTGIGATGPAGKAGPGTGSIAGPGSSGMSITGEGTHAVGMGTSHAPGVRAPRMSAVPGSSVTNSVTEKPVVSTGSSKAPPMGSPQ